MNRFPVTQVTQSGPTAGTSVSSLREKYVLQKSHRASLASLVNRCTSAAASLLNLALFQEWLRLLLPHVSGNVDGGVGNPRHVRDGEDLIQVIPFPSCARFGVWWVLPPTHHASERITKRFLKGRTTNEQTRH